MKNDSQDSRLQDWSKLLKNARETAAEIDGIVPLVETLEEAHSRAVSLRGRRQALLASTHKTTREINEAFAVGVDAAISLRSYLRGVLGPRSEKLVRYGVKPFRPRRPRRRVGRSRRAAAKPS